jgi:hypothetical protein
VIGSEDMPLPCLIRRSSKPKSSNAKIISAKTAYDRERKCPMTIRAIWNVW